MMKQVQFLFEMERKVGGGQTSDVNAGLLNVISRPLWLDEIDMGRMNEIVSEMAVVFANLNTNQTNFSILEKNVLQINVVETRSGAIDKFINSGVIKMYTDNGVKLDIDELEDDWDALMDDCNYDDMVSILNELFVAV